MQLVCMRFYFVVLLFLFFIPVINASIIINEIMYDPEENDNNHEWIEIYNNGNEEINLEGWKFYEANTNHGLELSQGDNAIINQDEYVVIVQNPNTFLDDYRNYSGKILDSVFSLSNEGEYLALKNSTGAIIDEVNYSGIVEEGRSLCKINNIWKECIATPGEENIEYQKPAYYVDRIIDGDTFYLTNNESVRLIGINTPERGEYYYLESKNKLKDLIEGKQVSLEEDEENRDAYGRLLRYAYINNTFVNLIMVQEGYARAYPYGNNLRYQNEFADAEQRARNSKLRIWLFFKNLKINEIMYNPLGADDNKEYIELYLDNAINLENYIIQDEDSQDSLRLLQFHNSSYALIVEEGFNYAGINASVYSAGITIGNNLNNDEDFIIIKYAQGDIIDIIHYYSEWGAYDNGMSLCKLNNLWGECIQTPGRENGMNQINNISYLDIDHIYLGTDNKARFGETLKVKVIVYKGDTSKYNLDLYVVDENNKQISKRSEINVEDKFTNYTLVVPVQIEPNCNMKISNGTYKIILKGLDASDTEEIEIDGITESLCETVRIQEKTSSEKTFVQQGLSNINKENETIKKITSAVLYESSDIKAKNLGILFFCAVLLIIIIYLIFSKNL